MKILEASLAITLVFIVFLYACMASEAYRCKNTMVFRSYVYTLIKSHDDKKAKKTFSCVSILNLNRYINSNYTVKFIKNKEEKYLKYKKQKVILGISNGLRPKNATK